MATSDGNISALSTAVDRLFAARDVIRSNYVELGLVDKTADLPQLAEASYRIVRLAEVDDTLSDTSTNAIQNKAVKKAIDDVNTSIGTVNSSIRSINGAIVDIDNSINEVESTLETKASKTEVASQIQQAILNSWEASY